MPDPLHPMTEHDESCDARRERIRRQSAELAARLAEDTAAAEFFADWDRIAADAVPADDVKRAMNEHHKRRGGQTDGS